MMWKKPIETLIESIHDRNLLEEPMEQKKRDLLDLVAAKSAGYEGDCTRLYRSIATVGFAVGIERAPFHVMVRRPDGTVEDPATVTAHHAEVVLVGGEYSEGNYDPVFGLRFWCMAIWGIYDTEATGVTARDAENLARARMLGCLGSMKQPPDSISFWKP